MNNTLLSICIPTYNRAEYLRATLENITTDPAFDDRVEIVISDNASTDHTQDVGMAFAEKFTNVRYYRNEHNVVDGNFIIVLSKGSGMYLKLANDTLHFNPGTLKFMLEKISEADEKRALMFCHPTKTMQMRGQYVASDINSLLDLIMFNIGWIGNFGMWKSDLDCLNVSQKYTQLKFVQVAWTLEILKKHGSTTIFSDYFFQVKEPAKKGGYNLFKVQVSNLFKIFKDYGLKGTNYYKQKHYSLKYFTMSYVVRLLFEKQPSGFDLSDSYKTLIKEYWFDPYFYYIMTRKYLSVKITGNSKLLKAYRALRRK